MIYFPFILIFLWAFFEASIWFIAADFLLIPFSIYWPEKWLKWTLTLVIGSCLGGILHYILIKSYPADFGYFLAHTPFVTERMHAFIRERFEKYGEWGALWQAWSFMSLKIWTFNAYVKELNPVKYFSIVVFSRMFRFFPEALLASYIGPKIKNKIEKRKWLYLFIYAVAFIGGLIIIEK